MTRVLLATLLAALAVLAWEAGRRSAAQRLRRLPGHVLAPRAPARAADGPPAPCAATAGARRWAAAGAGLAAGWLVGGPVGVVVGALVAAGTLLWLGRLEPAARRRERERCVAELPTLADLVAVGLRVGVPVDVALRAAGDSLGGPLGARAARVASLLALGGRDPSAWADLAGLPGGPPLTRTLARALEDGLAAGDGLARAADELRRRRRAAATAKARRVGAVAAAPLGLCLLPAFVLVAVVPLVVAGFAQLGR